MLNIIFSYFDVIAGAAEGVSFKMGIIPQPLQRSSWGRQTFG